MLTKNYLQLKVTKVLLLNIFGHLHLTLIEYLIRYKNVELRYLP